LPSLDLFSPLPFGGCPSGGGTSPEDEEAAAEAEALDSDEPLEDSAEAEDAADEPDAAGSCEELLDPAEAEDEEAALLLDLSDSTEAEDTEAALEPDFSDSVEENFFCSDSELLVDSDEELALDSLP